MGTATAQATSADGHSRLLQPWAAGLISGVVSLVVLTAVEALMVVHRVMPIDQKVVMAFSPLVASAIGLMVYAKNRRATVN